jgi:hypothetical protein
MSLFILNTSRTINREAASILATRLEELHGEPTRFIIEENTSQLFGLILDLIREKSGKWLLKLLRNSFDSKTRATPTRSRVHQPFC